MQLTGAEIIIECLKEQKVDTVFGYPGGAILNVYDALYKHSDEIQHILMRQTVMPVLLEKSGYAWQLQDLGLRIWLQVLLQLIWIPFRLWQSRRMLANHFLEEILSRK